MTNSIHTTIFYNKIQTDISNDPLINWRYSLRMRGMGVALGDWEQGKWVWHKKMASLIDLTSSLQRIPVSRFNLNSIPLTNPTAQM